MCNERNTILMDCYSPHESHVGFRILLLDPGVRKKMKLVKWLRGLFSKRRKRDREEILIVKEAAPVETIRAVTVAKPSIPPSREELVKQQTDRIKETFLPTPQAKRRVFPSHEHIPAAHHNDRISKLMGKHGGRMSKSYRRSVKARKSIREEDD